MHVLDRSMHTAYNKVCCCPVLPVDDLPSQKHRCWQAHSKGRVWRHVIVVSLWASSLPVGS